MCDLATAVENNVDIKFAILNNGSLGMVKQMQDVFYDKDYYAVEYSGNPDFVKLAAAYGIDGMRVTRKDEVDDAVRHAMEVSGPVIIDFVIKPDEQVYPWIPAGESVHEMIEVQPSQGGPY